MSEKKGNLLIVDDEELIVERIATLLEDYVDETYMAYDGEEGLEVFKANEIHCIICDIRMPKLNGLELIKEIRKIDEKVPFIFYTGHLSKELMLEVVKYGAFDFLDKPNLDYLEEVVQRGLKAGTQGPDAREPEADFMSDYRKLMDENGDK